MVFKWRKWKRVCDIVCIKLPKEGVLQLERVLQLGGIRYLLSFPQLIKNIKIIFIWIPEWFWRGMYYACICNEERSGLVSYWLWTQIKLQLCDRYTCDLFHTVCHCYGCHLHHSDRHEVETKWRKVRVSLIPLLSIVILETNISCTKASGMFSLDYINCIHNFTLYVDKKVDFFTKGGEGALITISGPKL